MPDHLCAICGCGVQGVDRHHVQFKGRGGSDDVSNLLTIDRRCHSAIHNEVIRIDQESYARGVLRVVEVESGEILIERVLERDADRWEGTTVGYLEQIRQDIEEYLPSGLEGAPLEELGTLCADLNKIERWPYEAEAVYRAYHGWLMWKENGQLEHRKTFKLNAIAKSWNLGPSRARQLYDICASFPVEDGHFARYVYEQPVRLMSVWRACSSQESPVLALAAVCEEALRRENMSADDLIAVAETKPARKWFVRIPEPEEHRPGEWVLMSALERERREVHVEV